MMSLNRRRTLARSIAFVVFSLLFAGQAAHAVKRRAFVTSTTGNGNLASWPGSSGATALERGDSICRAHAAAGGLPNAQTYRAWLSTASTDAWCHVQGLSGKKTTGCGGAPLPGGGPWYLRNGISSFTADLEALTGAERAIYRPVIFDESGAEPSSSSVRWVWTGTRPDGRADITANSTNNCLEWGSAAAGESASVGQSDGTAALWTHSASRLCNQTARLLCLEPGASEEVHLGWLPSAIVFVSSAMGKGDLSSWPQAGGAQGLAAGDAICRTLARQGGLPAPESFIAWLSTQAVDAADRLTLPADADYRRLDNFTIALSRADLLDGFAANSLHVDEQGRYLATDGTVFTGTNADGVMHPSTCGDWTDASPGQSARMGNGSLARGAQWTEWAFVGCNLSRRIYCFQNQVTAQLPLFADGFEIGSADRWSGSTP